MPSIFLDANVPMYAAGRAHPLKAPCVDVLTLVAERPRAFVTDAEVLQEILHRYIAQRAWSRGKEVLARVALLMAGRIEPVGARDVEAAALLADHHPDLAGRDLLHVAVMQRLGIAQIVSADHDFERIAGVLRLDPADVGRWRAQVAT